MIGKLSLRIVEKLIDLSVVSETEQELYSYGFFMMLSQILFLIVTIVFGSLLGIVLESVIFYISFQIIRRYAGGIHASTEWKCEISTTVSILICLLAIKVCKTHSLQTAILIPALAAAFCILLLCPLDTPEKPLSKGERKYFRKISWIILIITVVVISVARYFELGFLMYPCCMGLILESVLLVLGKIKEAAHKNSDNEF